jgi:hypothetical protein
MSHTLHSLIHPLVRKLSNNQRTENLRATHPLSDIFFFVFFESKFIFCKCMQLRHRGSHAGVYVV